MASSLISNSHHVDFDSVFGMDDATITQMFELLIATGLKGFLGCPAVYYEAALIEFFENGSVREYGVVVCTIRGINVEISEGMFATTFGLPTEGLTDVSDVPKDLVFDARSLFSESEEQTLFVKAGSFDAVTHERFMIMTAIMFDVKINWGSLLFGVLKAMVTPGSRQAKGYAIQICVVLSKVPGLELDWHGESRRFYPDEENRKETCVKERLASSETEVAPIAKKKHTTKGKPAAMALEAVPLQTIEPTADVPAELPPVPKRKSRKRRLVLEQDDDLVVDEPVKESATGVQETSTDVPASEEQPAADPDDIIEQILIQLDTAAATQGDKTETWFDRAFDEEFATTEQEKQDSEEEIDFDVAKTGEEASSSKHHPEELMSLDDLLIQISEDTMLPSVTAAEITKIRLGESINIQEVQERDVYYTSLPRISVHDKGKEPLVEDEPVRGNPARETMELICGDVDFLVQEVKELNAKVDAMATNLEILRRNAEATMEAISHQLLEFQAKIAADILSISIQIGELVDHIRGGDAKKGEIGSSSRRPPPVCVERRPLPTQANQAESSSGHGRVTRVEEAAEMVREADRQADRREREKEREKRLRRLRRRGH
ncbi:hypothetical protein F511_03494 [Dorcoceras hygrometricum]|uniref:Dystroglycan-like n=1 Tax=Dorcoceras hygrometricum TaxID=472368 RepID=A0A2Z7AY17_9LAMI|nr:hypothetical protein F511_03494 [Dorcoceras hygrometricum]